jgi:putative pre-16S rRNA nuclease
VSAIAKRVLALDPGTKRIGVALSDELGWTAQPLETFERKSLGVDIAHINELVRRHEVREIVIGMPVRLDGRMGPAAQSVQQFLDAVQAGVGVPVVAWDERLTTKAAEQMLIEADVSRKKRKGVVDRVAAALLLKSYLEHLSSHSSSDQQASDEA